MLMAKSPMPAPIHISSCRVLFESMLLSHSPATVPMIFSAATQPIGQRGLQKPFADILQRARGEWSAAPPPCSLLEVKGRLPISELVERFALGIASAQSAPHAHRRRLVQPELADRVYGPALHPFRKTNAMANYEACFLNPEGDILDKSLLADQRFHLTSGQLAKVDLMSMAHSLEIRVPFLDRRTMDFAGRCAGNLLSPGLAKGKRILHEIARRNGAPAAIHRGTKKGFNVPVARLLHGPLKPLADRLFEKEADLFAPLLDPNGLRTVWREHKAGRFNHGYALWPILVFGAWRTTELRTPVPKASVNWSRLAEHQKSR